MGNWSFNAAATRYGEFTVLFDPASANRDQTFGADWTLDLAATYNRNGWYFTLGGDNVTRRLSGRGDLRQRHVGDSVQRGFAVRLQRRLRVRQGRLQVVIRTA